MAIPHEPTFLELTRLDPIEQMRRSSAMLEQAAEETGLLMARVFTWDRVCITRGLRQRIEHLIDIDKARDLGIPIVERPTGGMLAFHGNDLAFGVAVSLDRPGWASLNVDAMARRVNDWIAHALNELGVPVVLPPAGSVRSPGPARVDRLCAASRTDSDLLLHGRKLLGASMRKKRGALLYEATLPLLPPPAEALALLRDEAYRARILAESTSLSEAGAPTDPDLLARRLRETLQRLSG